MVKEMFMFVCQNCTVITIETTPTGTHLLSFIPCTATPLFCLYSLPYPFPYHSSCPSNYGFPHHMLWPSLCPSPSTCPSPSLDSDDSAYLAAHLSLTLSLFFFLSLPFFSFLVLIPVNVLVHFVPVLVFLLFSCYLPALVLLLHFFLICYKHSPLLALPCLALPCLALPCLALPCLALPCLALPCLALPCLA
jgi:hypothetical protein